MPRHGPRHDSHHHRPGHHGGERHHNATRFAALADLPAAAPGGVLERLQQSFADEHLELAVLLGASLLCLAAWACLSSTAAVPASPCAQPISKAVSSERLVEPVVEGKPVPSSRGDTTVYRLGCIHVSSRTLPDFLSVFPARFPTAPSSFLGETPWKSSFFRALSRV